ncbi:unnamed protein product [Closterium sp. NIES-65]|nr:unnamed protein product [Closterium sp. NIES-65]
MCRVESLFGIKTVKMTNVRIIYLPANTTTFVQPLDQGLIACFKMRFRQLRVAELIKVFDEGTSGAELRRSKPGARLTVTWIGDSVKSIDASTIQRCFWRTGCLPDQWLPQLEHVTPTTMGSPSGVSQAVIADLSDAIQRLQLGHRAMSPMEFVCFDELQPTSELMEPNLELGVDCEMLNSELSFTMQTMTADALLDRSERRVARQATEVLITYARAKGIQPRELIDELEIGSSVVMDRLERASHPTIDLNVDAEEERDDMQQMQACAPFANEAELLAFAMEMLGFRSPVYGSHGYRLLRVPF